jgi:HEAT repeat protein
VEKESASELSTLLKDEDSSVRRAAVISLGRIGANAQHTIPAIVAALADAEVSLHAAEALLKIDPNNTDATGVLSRALQSRESLVKLNAIATIRDLGPLGKHFASDLKNALRDDDENVRHYAAEALAQINK